MFSKLKRKLNQVLLQTKDIHAAALLHQLTAQGNYFPLTGSSLNMHSMATVVNDIIINRRQSVIEFGAGFSTLCLARLVRDFGISTTIVSIDDNQQWTQLMQERLADEDLQDRVVFVYAPLTECEHSKNRLKWYDMAEINRQTESIPEYDVVLVDGPMAWDKPRALSRYPAVPFVRSKLADQYAVYLDDVHRKGEQEIASLWQAELGATKTKVNSNFVMFHEGDFFNPVV